MSKRSSPAGYTPAVDVGPLCAALRQMLRGSARSLGQWRVRIFERKFGTDFLATVPREPGIYRMYDAAGAALRRQGAQSQAAAGPVPYGAPDKEGSQASHAGEIGRPHRVAGLRVVIFGSVGVGSRPLSGHRRSGRCPRDCPPWPAPRCNRPHRNASLREGARYENRRKTLSFCRSGIAV